MTTVERSLQLPASPSQVWAVLADFGAISAWAPNVDHSCLLSGQTEGIGAVRRIQVGRATIRETVLAWEPESTLTCSITGLPPVIRSVTNTWRLEPAGTRTTATLTSEIDAGPRPPQQAVARVVGRTLAKASDQMLGGLAVYLTAQQHAREVSS
jgi:hypothetical protein